MMAYLYNLQHAIREVVANGNDYFENIESIKSRVCGDYQTYRTSKRRKRNINTYGKPVTENWKSVFEIFKDSDISGGIGDEDDTIEVKLLFLN